MDQLFRRGLADDDVADVLRRADRPIVATTQPRSKNRAMNDIVGAILSKHQAPVWRNRNRGPFAGNRSVAKTISGPSAIGIRWGPSFIADAINRRAYFLVTPTGTAKIRPAWRPTTTSSRRRPGLEHRFLFLVEPKDLQNYRDAGLPAVICIHTAFVDERCSTSM
jgi:hypothetical protein